MNIARIALAAFVTYFAIGFLVFAAGPTAVYRPQDSIKKVMPAGMAAMLVSMVVLAVLYAMTCHGSAGLALIGIFAVCAFVVHNYVNLNIGLRLTIGQAVAYFVEWVAVGAVIGLIYRPATP